MPAAAKGKAPAANGATKGGKQGGKVGSNSNSNSKAESSSATASGTATPTTTAASESPKVASAGGSGKLEKPDKKKYDEELTALKAEIDAKQALRNKLDEQIRSLEGGGPGAEKKKALKDELNELSVDRNTSRTKIFEQIKAKKEALEKKKKDLQTAKGKIPHKNVQELDAHIKHLEKQVESGSLKLGDEKRALAEITTSRRHRKQLEALQANQDAIASDQTTLDDLHKQLDDPELKAAHERADAIRAELDQMRKDSDENFANKNKLFDQRGDLKAELDVLYGQKRESIKTFKEASDRYYEKVQVDRQRRQEEFKAKRKADEDGKRRAIALELREDAEIPAFQEEIEDCQTLIAFFSGKGTGVKERADPVSSKAALVGVPELEIRQVETAPAADFVQFKKKAEEEDVYFVGGKGKWKGKKNGGGGKAKPNGSAATDGATNGDAAPPSPSSSDKLQIPLATLRALLKMSIPPPSSPADVLRAVEDLKTKKAWFEANQTRVTKENVAKAEAQIQKLSNEPASTKASNLKSGPATPASDVPPNETSENPAEPFPTPLSTDTLSVGVESEKVDEVLDDIQNVQEEVEVES